MEGPYFIRNDTVHFKRHAAPTLKVTEMPAQLAVCIGKDGALMKHGEASAVEAWHRATEAVVDSMGDFSEIVDRLKGMEVQVEAEALRDFFAVDLLRFPATEATVEELNRCISTNSRVLQLKENLRALLDADQEMAPGF